MILKTTAQSHSLKTPDLASGLALSNKLARQIADNFNAARQSAPKPGGMNYLDPAPVPYELIASILLAAVSIANDGWPE